MIEEEVLEMVRDFYSNVDELLKTSKTFLDDYKLYEQLKTKDVSALKERMKEAIIRGTHEQ